MASDVANIRLGEMTSRDLTGVKKEGSNGQRGTTFREKFGYTPAPQNPPLLTLARPRPRATKGFETEPYLPFNDVPKGLLSQWELSAQVGKSFEDYITSATVAL